MRRGRRVWLTLAVSTTLGLFGAVAAVWMGAGPRHGAIYDSWRRSRLPLDVDPSLAATGPTPASAVTTPRSSANRSWPGPLEPSTDPGRAVLTPGPDGRIRLPFTAASSSPTDGMVGGWSLREFAGHASVDVVRADFGLALRLRSEATSFALYRSVVVDLREFPVLSWSWKVTRLPAGGDVRRKAADDEAAQVYVVFPRWPSPKTNSDVVGYVWDTTAPVGTTLASPHAGNVKIIVVESGAARLGSWQRQQRNVARDYETLFGRQAPRVGSVAVMIDSNDTRDVAEALIGDVAFSRDSTPD